MAAVLRFIILLHSLEQYLRLPGGIGLLQPGR